jgi:predicted nucleic acid-binding protein
MKVLVDTSVWSLALRRNEPGEITKLLTDLIKQSLVVLVGPVRQEILSGISSEEVYESLKSKLQTFDELQITTKDYETAASFFNICRKNGVQGSHTDFLICSIASNNNLLILTTDKDFDNYMRYLPIRLYDQTRLNPFLD